VVTWVAAWVVGYFSGWKMPFVYLDTAQAASSSQVFFPAQHA